MKRICIFTLAAALLLAACASKPAPDQRAQVLGAHGVPQPEWMYKMPKSSEFYYVVGNGRPAQTHTAREGTARSDGLAKLSQWKAGTVADTMKNYVEEGGTTGSTQALERFEQATITRSTANISGFTQDDMWEDAEGAYHILFSYPKADLRSDFNQAVSDFKRSEAAAFAEFKADQAFKYLEAQLDKE